MNTNKPLGHRSYGSIPHLPGSRTGIGDYHLNEGQAKIATEKVRDDGKYLSENIWNIELNPDR